MKKVFSILILFILVFSLSGCFSKDELSNDKVYTSIYPIYYLTNYLYGTEKSISSIYPTGADVNNYVLTNKQKEEYQKSALFVYNGLTKEKELARD